MKPNQIQNFGLRSCRQLIKVLATISLIVANTTFATPTENPSQVLTRTAQSGMSLQTTLTKNQYSQEAYQEEYDVQVPYQDTETYYVDVPYQEEEAYTDYEQSCHNQYQCHDVPKEECGYQNVCRQVPRQECGYENVCQQVPRQSCHSENVCRSVPGEQVCHQERLCKPVPGPRNCEEVTECGTNALGQEICKTRKVCHDGPSSEDCDYIQKCEAGPSRQECGYQQVCETNYENECRQEHRCETRNVNECNNEYQCHTTSRQECGYEQVCQSVPVTKYRTVTKTRQEARTREVTRYRTESRCCVTKYRDVYDHQDSLSVLLQFPTGSELLPNEKEKIQVSFFGDLTKPDISVEDAGTVLGYKVSAKSINGSQANVELALTAKYSPEQVGAKTISALKLLIKPQGSAIAFTDAGNKARINSSYSIVVKDKSTGSIVAQTKNENAGTSNVVIPLNQVISPDLDYTIELTVQRDGIVLAAPVTFAKKAEYLFDRIDSSQLGRESLKSIALKESADVVNLTFTDTGADTRYETDYSVVMTGNLDQKIVFSKTYKAEEILKADKSATIAIPTADLDDSQDYTVTLAVSRSGHVLSAPVQFETQGKYARLLNPAPYSDPSLVGNLDIQNTGNNAVLIFKDAAPAHAAVKKTYHLVLKRQAGFLNLKKETFLDKVLTADQVVTDSNGVAKIKLAAIGVSSGDLSKYVQSGKLIFVDVTFVRQSPRLNNGAPISIDKSTKIRLE